MVKNILQDHCLLQEKKKKKKMPVSQCFLKLLCLGLYLCFLTFFGLLLQTDLVNTIGESAALGAAGVVLWGSMQYASSKVAPIGLLAFRNHINTFSLPPYPSLYLSIIIIVTSLQLRMKAQKYFKVLFVLCFSQAERSHCFRAH